MDYKVLYRKYRPDDFDNIIGQNYTVSILKNAIQNDKISHAYIFAGPRGTGKTSTAKVFAKAINCEDIKENGPCGKCRSCVSFKENADIIEIDAASNNGVDEIRELINNIRLAPSYSKYKVYIIDEVHMLSQSAFNALLLTLEEPPKHVVFILATTNIEAVPITILSRCQRFDFRKISIEDIIKRLEKVVKEEKINIDKEALEEIAYISEGGMRDALSILDQLASSNNKITINEVIEHFGSVSKKQIDEVYNCIITNNAKKFIEMMKEFKKLAIDYKLLVKKMLEKIEDEAIRSKIEENYNGLEYSKLKDAAFELAGISNFININIDPYLLIEITLLKYFNNKNTINKDISAPQQEKKSENYFPGNNLEEKKDSEVDNDFINIRINNCFVNAKKEYLQNMKKEWKNLPDKIKDNNILVNLIIDTDIAAASDKNAIIITNIESTVNLLNEKLEEISNYFDNKIKFVAITEEKWNSERIKYIDNLKNKHVYEYINESNIEKVDNEKTNKIEESAFHIFDKDKIEIE